MPRACATGKSLSPCLARGWSKSVWPQGLAPSVKLSLLSFSASQDMMKDKVDNTKYKLYS